MGTVFESRRAQIISVSGRRLVLFCSNDYLGLSIHPMVLEAAVFAAKRFGCGTGGAPGTSGTTKLHSQLSEAIARFKHRDRAVIFSSGFSANVAIHQALEGDDTIFFCDKSHHPSANDGIKLSGCPRRLFDHRDLDSLEDLLKTEKHSRKIVTLPSVFTLDGSITPLDGLAALKKRYDFMLILDEAHATGCVGATGRGLEEMYSLTGVADFIMGTFSKALGSQGGFLTFSNAAAKLLARPFKPFIYSTSLSAMSVAASLQALELLIAEPEMVGQMRHNITSIYNQLSQTGFSLNCRGSHIINAYFPSREKTTQVIEEVRRLGYFVVDIHIAELVGIRITAMATHTQEEIDGFCRALKDVAG